MNISKLHFIWESAGTGGDVRLRAVAGDPRFDLTGPAVAAGHDVRVAPSGVLTDAVLRDLFAGLDVIVLVPEVQGVGGDDEAAAALLLTTITDAAPAARVIFVSSFAVGHGRTHGLSELTGIRGQRSFERALRSRGNTTIVRRSWFSDDPPGVHGIAVSRSPLIDGQIAPGDVADVILAVLDQPDLLGRTFAVHNVPGPPDAGQLRRAIAATYADVEATAA